MPRSSGLSCAQPRKVRTKPVSNAYTFGADTISVERRVENGRTTWATLVASKTPR
jgi:hypothetical protein